MLIICMQVLIMPDDAHINWDMFLEDYLITSYFVYLFLLADKCNIIDMNIARNYFCPLAVP